VRFANQQLITLWQLEALWRTTALRSHTIFRRGYNLFGPIIARRITSPWVADAAYVALKPAELLARLIVILVATPGFPPKLQAGVTS
jgi:hypothetical protein